MFRGSGSWRRRLRFDPCQRLELLDAAVGHQGEEEVAILDNIRPDITPLLDDPIVQRSLRTFWRESAPIDRARANWTRSISKYRVHDYSRSAW